MNSAALAATHASLERRRPGQHHPGPAVGAGETPPRFLPPEPDQSFARVLRAALHEHGLPLERIRERLRQQGINISLSTLSYWQSGRSQPERPSSLHAVHALEAILELPADTLRSRLGPRRPRGRSPRPDTAGLRRFLGENSALEQTLGRDFLHLNQHMRQLTQRTTVRVDEDRSIRSISTHMVVRALNGDANGVTVIHEHDTRPAQPLSAVARFGTVDRVRHVPELRSSVVDILLDQKLIRNQTAILDFDLLAEPLKPGSTYYQQTVPAGLRGCLLHVTFHPRALPVSCQSYQRARHGGDKLRIQRCDLDASYSVHALTSRHTGGVHGISWNWAD